MPPVRPLVPGGKLHRAQLDRAKPRRFCSRLLMLLMLKVAIFTVSASTRSATLHGGVCQAGKTNPSWLTGATVCLPPEKHSKH
jgi:hypothetical protein